MDTSLGFCALYFFQVIFKYVVSELFDREKQIIKLMKTVIIPVNGFQRCRIYFFKDNIAVLNSIQPA